MHTHTHALSHITHILSSVTHSHTHTLSHIHVHTHARTLTLTHSHIYTHCDLCLCDYQAEADREERYFDNLEKKEMMEEKMKSVTSMEVTVYTCTQVSCQFQE